MSWSTLAFAIQCPARAARVRHISRSLRWLPFLGSALLALISAQHALALSRESYVSSEKGADRFALYADGQAAPLYADGGDYPGVLRALRDLQADIERVTKVRPDLATRRTPAAREVVIVGTLGKSQLVDQLVRDKKLDATGIAGRWEASLTQVVDRPLPGVEQALVIAGSDKRGTIYGIYDLSEQIGVSPWYWWADVPVRQRRSLYVLPGRHARGEPAVKYRGIFINDEAPCLSGWTKEKFGGFNHQFSEKVFELLLRLRANYLWPAMWGSAFNEDDPENPRLADEYGIVMGTSHQEPMLRAQAEFDRRHKPDLWNYATHPDFLEKFWREGVRRNKDYESIITIGMRGRNDTEMIPGATVEQSAALLEKIVAAQRKILAEEMNRDVTKVPQVWCLYKEVQDYYEHGLRVPDDVTLLWADDNWGDLRRVPTLAERKRKGGAGIYYHFDYVGGPRCYKWINTNPLGKIWEQMSQANRYGATRIWVVNVGDIKPMEVPMDFFFTMAWDPAGMTPDREHTYVHDWAVRTFGPEHADAIAELYNWYTAMNGRRKPELLNTSPDGIYSLLNYGEADQVLGECQTAVARAEALAKQLPADQQDAYFELVLHPVKATAIVNQLYILAGKNHLYAEQGRPEANALAAQVRARFAADAALTHQYNHDLANGKWDHMMDQPHLGYISWGEPKENTLPPLQEVKATGPARLGVAVEGMRESWPPIEPAIGSGTPVKPEQPSLATFDSVNQQRHYIDVFNRGTGDLEWTVKPSQPWIVLNTKKAGPNEARVWVSIDWTKLNHDGDATVDITAGQAKPVRVAIRALHLDGVTRDSLNGFVENAGVVSAEAGHFTGRTKGSAAGWQKIDGNGRTEFAMTILPFGAASVTPIAQGTTAAPRLEYRMYLFKPGPVSVHTYVSPTLNFVPGRGLRYAVAFDDQPPQIVDILADGPYSAWNEAVAQNARIAKSSHMVAKSGYHTLKIWMVDPGVVLQKIIVDAGGLENSYLGPPESFSRRSATEADGLSPSSPALPKRGRDL
ncbi:MAG: glycosyl hydrolase 115 family protein [Planctomycetes bacterium]|nr:glycosyl hydrolase 115 family protein [Planctomycetota bacterium]